MNVAAPEAFSAMEPRSVLPSHTRVSSSSATPGWAAIRSRSRVSNPVTSSWARSSRNVESDGDLPKSLPSSSLSGWRCLLAKAQPSPSGVTLLPHQRALAAENRQDGHQQHPPLGEADAPAHPAVRQRLEEADQIACCSRGGGLGSQGSGAAPAQLTVGATAGRDLLGQTSNRPWGAPRPPTVIELSPPLEKVKRRGPRRAERRRRKPMAIRGLAQKAYLEVEGRPGGQPDPHPPQESGQGSPEPVRTAKVRQRCDTQQLNLMAQRERHPVTAESDTSVLFPAC
jgi:hypothetical protein